MPVDPDPLSEFLTIARPRFSVAAALDAGGSWSIQFPGGSEIRFQAVIAGTCLLEVEGASDVVHLGPGDCFLSIGSRFRLASDLDAPSTPAYSVFSAKREGVAVHNGGGDFEGLGCLFSLREEHARLFRELLPPIMHLGHGAAGQLALRSSLDQMMEEARRSQPGSKLVMRHLSQIMLIQALRLHAAGREPATKGWLAAFTDRRLSQVLAAVHHSPERRWALQSLAACAGMSRTSFALHFKNVVGVTPMDYLVRWRMLLAADYLEAGEKSVSEIACAVGYGSDSAFGVAYKRIMGLPPRARFRGPAISHRQ